MIFNTIADGRLANPFSIEDIVELFLQPCVSPVGSLVYEAYCDAYTKKFADKKILLTQIEQIRAIFDACRSGDAKSCGKAGEQLVDMLDDASNIETRGDQYEFCFYDAHANKLHVTQDPDVLDTWFSSALRPFTVM